MNIYSIFYFRHSKMIEEPKNIELREFGFRYPSGVVARHMAFKHMKELLAQLVKENPTDVYCSNAIYSDPSARPMEAKGWQGADMIFDIDAPDKEAVKDLCTILNITFGIAENKIHIYFSGNKGFHIHVIDSNFSKLDADSRLQVVQYILKQQPRLQGILDGQVTTDIHRIFRMPGTINSKRNLLKVRVTDIDSFVPEIHAVVPA